MTTPTQNSAYRIICTGMQHAGLLGLGQQPNSEQLALYLGRLNDVLKFEQTQGLKIWLQYNLPITLVASQPTYTIMSGGAVNLAKPTRMTNTAYYSSAEGVRRPLEMISRSDYNKLGTVIQEGPITQYWPDKQIDRIVVAFWLVPDIEAATGTAYISVQQQVGTLTNITETVNFPDEWTIALGWMLAADICTGQPQAITDRCEFKAAFYRSELNAWDTEDGSVFFQMNNQRRR